MNKGLPQVSLAARAEERFFAPVRRGAFGVRSRFIAVLALVLSVHAAILGWFLYRDSTAPDVVAQAVETPVEMVQEPPPPPEPPPPKQPPPQPPAKEKPPELMNEKPATSAPRAPSPQPVDTRASDAKTEAPKAPVPPRDGQPDPSEAEATAPEPPAAAEAKEAAAPKLEDDRRDAEPLDKAKPASEKPDEAAAKAEPASKARDDAARRLAGLTDDPGHQFAAATPMSEFPAGTEDNRYLSVVYAKVMSKNRYLKSAAARRGARGMVSVSFVVDFMGRVPYQAVSESSGQPDLDALAMTAVRTAAPFPPPPGSGSQQLVARMSFGP